MIKMTSLGMIRQFWSTIPLLTRNSKAIPFSSPMSPRVTKMKRMKCQTPCLKFIPSVYLSIRKAVTPKKDFSSIPVIQRKSKMRKKKRTKL